MIEKKKLKEQVEHCLFNYPDTANSDISLTIRVWKSFYPELLHNTAIGKQAIFLDDLYELPREDNIKRIRAKFNSEGIYFPTNWEVAKKRRINEDTWKLFMGYTK